MSQTVTPFRTIAPHRPAAPRASSLWQRLLQAWLEAATRRQLATLDDRALQDIGVSRAQAQFEAERPVWAALASLHR